MPMIDVEDRVRVHVQDLGTGPAVVFISGFGLDHELWDRQVRVLAGAGHRTVCVTQRGHGGSDHPLHGYDIDRLSADLVSVLETLGVGDATVVGHSFGGQVAFHTAATAPHLVAKLVLVGSLLRHRRARHIQPRQYHDERDRHRHQRLHDYRHISERIGHGIPLSFLRRRG